MKKCILLFSLINFFYCLAETNPVQINNFERRTIYTLINNTQEPMDVEWVTGGGPSFNELTGLSGSVHISPNTSPSNRGTIVASGTDCITAIKVTSSTFSNMIAKGEDICERTISIEYQGELKDRKLVLKY